MALQEIGRFEALTPLQKVLGWEMRHVALGQPDARGIRVAFLSTRILTNPTDVRLFPPGMLPVQVGDDPPGPEGPALMNQMGRGALEVTVRAGGRDVTIVNCHLKSKLLSFPGGRFSARDENERARYAAFALYRRAAEATTLRSHVTDRLAGRGRDDPFVLVGDLNDEPDAATTQVLHGPPGSVVGTAGFARPDAGDGDRLWNLAGLLPPEQAQTRVYRGRGEIIDHVLVSHTLVADSLPDITTVVPEGVPIPSIDDNPNNQRNLPGSDHAAVLATLTL